MLFTPAAINENSAETNSTPSIEGRTAKRKKIIWTIDDYVDCSFILGSFAEVERVWSIAKFVLSDHRKRMTP